MDDIKHQRELRSLSLAVRDASLHATPDEHTDLLRVVQNVQAGDMSVDMARGLVAQLRRDQSARRELQRAA